MMHNTRSIGIAVFAMIITSCAWGVSERVDGYTWRYYIYDYQDDVAVIEGDCISASGNSFVPAVSPNPTGVVTIPSTLGGKPVVVGEYALWGCSDLRGVIIADGITSIRREAFAGCSGLTSVTIPDSVTGIGDEVFKNCASLTNITIPDGMTSVGTLAFRGCTSLTKVTIPQCLCDDGRFSISFPSELPIKTIVISDGVTSIGRSAFRGRRGLTSVTIPDGVTSIWDSAFDGCSGLTSITMPDSVTSIGAYAFSGCSGLTSITIPDSVMSIGSSAFSGCPGLISVTIPDSVAGIGSSAFSDCIRLTSVTVPQCVCSSIFSKIFSGSQAIRDVNISSSVISIGANAFDGSSGLTNVIIPDSVKSIGDNAFSGCSGLTNIAVPNSVTNIGASAFSSCAGLTSVAIPDSVKSVGRSAFYNCSGLTSVAIPDSVKSIGQYAFYNCSGLTEVMIPNSVTTIGNNAFKGCSGLTSLTIPEGVTSVGSEAFCGCRGFTGVTIPNSVTTIGNNAFKGCSGLTSVTIPWRLLGKMSKLFPDSFDRLTAITLTGTADLIPDSAFEGCVALESINIPSTVTNIAANAFLGCSGLKNVMISQIVCGLGLSSVFPSAYQTITNIRISDDVTNIVNGAFVGCNGLTSVTIPQCICSSKLSSVFPDAYATITNILIDGSVSSVGRGTFDGCSESVYDLSTIPGVKLIDGWVVGYTDALSGNRDLTGVRGVADEAFRNCSGLTGIILPDSMTRIQDRLFYGCSRLASVTIPESVTSIGQYAFYNSSRLTSITFPDGIARIGDEAFYGCSALKAVYISDIAKWCRIAFGNSGANPLRYAHNLYLNGALIRDLTIPVDVTNVMGYAFYNCSGLTSMTIPDSVTSIGAYAFSGCSGLTSVTIPDSVTSIGAYAFSGCSGLTSATVPVGVTNIMDYAFNNCSGLTSVTIPDSVTSIGRSAFRDCRGLTSVTIPDSVTSIGAYAFSGCSGLTSITIPDSVTSIGSSAFSGCNGLTKVTMPWTLVTEMSSMFPDSYDKLNGVRLTGEVTEIPANAFKGCIVLESFSIPNSVARIGNYAFSGCSGLADITLPDCVASIGSSAFSGCSGLTSITIPGNVSDIEPSVFRGCSGLTNVEILCTVPYIKAGLSQARFDTRFDISSALADTSESHNVSGVIAAYKQVDSAPWEFSDPLTGETFAWKESYSTFAYFGQMYLVGGKTYVFGAHIDDDAYVKIDGNVIVNVKSSSGYSIYTGRYSCGASGWYDVEFRLGDITGGKGAWGVKWSNDFGLGYRDDGKTDTTQSQWKRLLDPGDGSLFRCEGGSVEFSDCGNIMSVTMPWAMVTQMSSMFPDSYYKLRSVKLTGDATEIPGNAFRGCSAIENITIPSNVNCIGASAFQGCSGLTSIVIPEGVTNIGTKAFSDCPGLADSDGMVIIGNVLYNYFGESCSVTIPAGIAIIEDSAFRYCDKLTSVGIPDGLKIIGDSAFIGCNSLTNLIVPDSVERIGNKAFHGCNGLRSVTMPLKFITSMSDLFPDAYVGMESVSLTGMAAEIPANGFAGCTSLSCVKIPDGVRGIGASAFAGCSNLTEVVIPGSVWDVGEGAFAGCTGLRHVELPIGLKYAVESQGVFVGCPEDMEIVYVDAEMKDVSAKQRWPWNGKVDVRFMLTGSVGAAATPEHSPVLTITAKDVATGKVYAAAPDALSGDTDAAGGAHHVVWDLNAQGIEFASDDVVFTVAYTVPQYCVIDLSRGANAATYPVSFMAAPPIGGFNKDAYKTSKLVLRLVEPGSFMMGGEYEVSLTKPYYAGLFEVTQKQYSLVTGSNPSEYKGDTRPVEQVSWNAIRGDSSACDWPNTLNVDADSFVGRLQKRTGLMLDLPTEAQWEYACRAGTTSKYNNGGDSEADLKLLGRYSGNTTDGKGGYSQHTKVGSYQPNAWGLYDMHGNVLEWCLDWHGSLSEGVDPVGAVSGSDRVRNGGSWFKGANYCASSCRGCNYPSEGYNDYGFRIVGNLSDLSKYAAGDVADGEWYNTFCSGVSASVAIDSRAGIKPVLETLVIPWDASWVGGDTNATVVIADNGVEVKRATGVGELVLTDTGRHELTYTTYIGNAAQKEVYTATIFKDWKFEISGGGAVVTATTQTSGAVTIPSEINGYNVTGIGSAAFAGCSNLIEVVIPESVWDIGKGAFANCAGLRRVEVPRGLKSVIEARNVFAGCPVDMEIVYVGAEIKNVTAKQRYPWNGKVDVTYEISGNVLAGLPAESAAIQLVVTAEDRNNGTNYVSKATALSGDVGIAEGSHHVVWDLDEQGIEFLSDDVMFTVTYFNPYEYCVIDLSAGPNAKAYPVSYTSEPPNGDWTDEYKATKLVLRWMDSGSFKMGEASQIRNVTLTKPFYIGVFEITQRQWELVAGSNPCSSTSYGKGDTYPVHNVSYNMIRGSVDGALWPASSAVDTRSFIGLLRMRTGIDFDLPTEAEWEYACRAGTTTTYSYGNSVDGNYMWYGSNSGGKTLWSARNPPTIGDYMTCTAMFGNGA